MPHYNDSRGARRKKLFTRASSTFINNKSKSNSSILDSDNMLHSKSTYFYRWGSRKQLSSKLSYVIPSVCTLALLVGGIIAINPIITNIEIANAENEPVAQTNAVPTISLSLTGGEAYQQTTAETDKIVYRNNIFKVTGTGIAKYSVSLSTANGGTGELVGKNNPYATVGKVAPNTTPANFKNNNWGYAVSKRNTIPNDTDMTYSPVPSSTDGTGNNTKITERDAIHGAEVDDSYKITFAAKLGKDLPADHYEANVYISVVATAAYALNITTMQEMTTSVCNSIPDYAIEQQFQLKDTRDQKKYWISKLKDGNCWMTQNLDYNGGGDSTLISNWKSGNTSRAYYDPGNYVYNVSTNGQNGDCTNSIFTQCSTQFSLIDPSNNNTTTQERMHYHIGNYYSWNAATNGTGGSITSGEANGSICPIGWKLPTSNNTNKGSFTYLLTQYGVQSSSSGSNSYTIYNTPLYFVYGGYLTIGKLEHAGIGGYYWSSTPVSSGMSNTYDFAHDLYLGSNVNPSNYMPRYYGLSVRCVTE